MMCFGEWEWNESRNDSTVNNSETNSYIKLMQLQLFIYMNTSSKIEYSRNFRYVNNTCELKQKKKFFFANEINGSKTL